MKKINDENIVKFVKDNTDYQVKTTSSSILNQYAYEKKLEEQTKPTSKKKLGIVLGSIFGTLGIVGAVVAGVVFIKIDNNNPNNIVFPDTNPSNNTVLKKQLITFSAFTTINNSKNIINKIKLMQNDIDEDEEDEDNTPENDLQELVKKSVDLYEEVEQSVNYLYHEKNVSTETTSITARFDNIEYSKVTKFYYGDSKVSFASYYFNENEENKDDKKTRTSKAYYECNDLHFNIDVKEEAESENDEEEIETTLIFRDVNKVDKHVYVIEKEVENEIEDNKTNSENSLTISIYKDESSFSHNDFIKKIKSETEVEDDENEIEVSIKTKEYEVEYQITKLNEHNLDLQTELEELTNDERSFENEHINLEYKDGLRIYTWNSSSWTY